MLDHPAVRPVETPEDVVRQYEAALYDFARDDATPHSALKWIAFVFSILAFASLCFGAGLGIAAAWSSYDDVPARGVMDGTR